MIDDYNEGSLFVCGGSSVSLRHYIDNVERLHPLTETRFPAWNRLYMEYRERGGSLSLANFVENGSTISDVIENINRYYKSESTPPVNRMVSYVVLAAGKMLAGEPYPMAEPVTLDVSDIETARVSTAALTGAWKKSKVNMKLFDFIIWSMVVGTSYMKASFVPGKNNDPSFGSMDVVTQSDTLEKNKGDDFFSDDSIAVQVISPFLVFPDPTAKDIAEARWYMHLYTMPLSVLREKYPDAVDLDVKDDATDISGINTEVFGFEGAYAHGDTSKVKEKSVIVREFWRRGERGIDHGFGSGRGMLVIRAGGQDVFVGPNPYKDWLNIFKYTVRRCPSDGYGDGILWDLIGLNKRTNDVEDIFHSNLVTLGKAKILMPMGTLVRKVEAGVDGPSGSIFEYDATYPSPSQMQVSPLPPNALNYKHDITETMREVSGILAPSYGELPVRATGMASKTLGALMEPEKIRFGAESRLLGEVLGDLASFILVVMRDNFKGKMYGSIPGSDSLGSWFIFKNSDLNGTADISVSVQDSFGSTTTLDNDSLLALFDRQIIDKEQFVMLSKLKATRVLDYYKYIERAKADINLIVEFGRMPIVPKYSNHEYSIKVGKEAIDSPESLNYDKITVELLDRYIQEHELMQFEEKKMEVMRMVALQQAASQPQQDQTQGRTPSQSGVSGQESISRGEPQGGGAEMEVS